MPLYLEVIQMIKSVSKQSSFARFAKPVAAFALASAALVIYKGCVAMFVGGAVVGTMAAIDRRTLGAQTEDKAIVLKGESAIKRALLSDGRMSMSIVTTVALC